MNYQDEELMQIFSILDLHSRADRKDQKNGLDEISCPEQWFNPIKHYILEMKPHRKLRICAQSGY